MRYSVMKVMKQSLLRDIIGNLKINSIDTIPSTRPRYIKGIYSTMRSQEFLLTKNHEEIVNLFSNIIIKTCKSIGEKVIYNFQIKIENQYWIILFYT